MNQQSASKPLTLSTNTKVNSVSTSPNISSNGTSSLVRALYDYAPEKPDALSFRAGDVILVTRQLESGWWNGIIQGTNKQGWFPSNYIDKRDLVLSPPLSVPPSPRSTSSTPLPQLSNNASRQNLKIETSNKISDSGLRSAPLVQSSTLSPNQRRRMSSSSLGGIMPNSPKFRTHENGSLPSSPNSLSQYSVDISAIEVDSPSSEAQEILPEGWTKHETNEGTTFFYNAELGQTTWTAPGRRSSKQEHLAPLPELELQVADERRVRELASLEKLFPELPKPLVFNDQEPVTWESVIGNLIFALNSLRESISKEEKNRFIAFAAAIVEAVRNLFAATGRMEREAMNQEKTLRRYHRKLMKSIPKLVYASKQAVGVWPPPNATQQLQAEADEVLHYSVAFITEALALKRQLIQTGILYEHERFAYSPASVHNSAPTSPVRSEASAGPTLSISDWVSRFNESSKNLVTLLKTYQDRLSRPIQIENNEGDSVNPIVPKDWVQQTRDISQETMALLALMDEFLSATLEPAMTDAEMENLSMSREALLNELLTLTSVANDADKQLALANVPQKIIVIVENLESAVQQLVMEVKFVYENRHAQQDRAMNDHILSMDTMRRPSDISTMTATPLSATVPQIPTLPQLFEEPEEESPVEEERIHSSSKLSRFFGEATFNSSRRPSLDTTKQVNQSGSSVLARKASSSTANASSGKVSRFFGDALDAQIPVAAIMHKRKGSLKAHTLLAPDYSPADLTLNMEGGVKSGTIEALVERLTFHEGMDNDYMLTFLLTFHSFMSSDQLFYLLIGRFNLAQPEGLQAEDRAIWLEKKQTPIRLRVVNVIKSWMENYMYDSDFPLLDKIVHFAETFVQPVLPTASGQLIKMAQNRKTQGLIPHRRQMMESRPERNASPTVTPSRFSLRYFRGNHPKFTDMLPAELAAQITIMESQCFRAIEPLECLDRAWSQADVMQGFHIRSMIELSNQITGWAAELILIEAEIDKRCRTMKKLLYLAAECLKLNNFNTVMSILASLNSAPIYRLKRTWEMLPKKAHDVFETLKHLMDSKQNFANYRQRLRSVNPPAVPFLGLVLTDLTFIDEGNTNVIRDTGHINFDKRTKSAKVIYELESMQQKAYLNLEEKKPIRDYLEHCLQNSREVQDLYGMSLMIEPREDQEEQIARRLHESGFL